MSTETPPSARVPALRGADVDETADDTTTTAFWVGGGALILLVFLGALCIGGLLLASLVGGHPITDIFLTPAPH
jgi:hypothetical protein